MTPRARHFPVCGAIAAIVTSSSTVVAEVPRRLAVMDTENFGVAMAFGDRVLFRKTTLETGAEPWITDGTEAGTRLLADVRPGTAGSNLRFLATANGLAYFGANPGASFHDMTVFSTDGTTVQPVATLPGSVRSCHIVGNRFFFVVADAASSMLWGSDGTQAGTLRLTTAPNMLLTPGEIIGQRYIFRGTTQANISGPWVSDGTAAGTHELIDLEPGPGSPSFGPVVPFAGYGYFFAYSNASGGRWRLLRTDGTEPGTSEVFALSPEPLANATAPQDLTATGDRLFFWASNGAGGVAPFTSSGATGAPALVGSLTRPNLQRNEFRRIGDDVFFGGRDGSGSALFATNPADGAVRQLHAEYVVGRVHGERLVFAASNSDIWTTDGSVAGTRRMAMLDSSHGILNTPFVDGGFSVAGDRVYLVLRRGSSNELWTLDPDLPDAGGPDAGPEDGGTEDDGGATAEGDGGAIDDAGTDASGPDVADAGSDFGPDAAATDDAGIAGDTETEGGLPGPPDADPSADPSATSSPSEGNLRAASGGGCSVDGGVGSASVLTAVLGLLGLRRRRARASTVPSALR